jgi:hypothetical protein
MGAFIADIAVPDVQTELNNRFAPGHPLEEMIAIQKEFDIFSHRHSLAHVSSLLNIAPRDSSQRRGWFRYLGHLKRVPSDEKGVNAHDRVVMTLKENLESNRPMPVFFVWHPETEQPELTVSRGNALVFSATHYIMISAPIALAPG